MEIIVSENYPLAEMNRTAFILLGFQNDFFSSEGILHSSVKENLEQNRTLENTLNFLDAIKNSESMIITTPINFSDQYQELDNPQGLMAIIRDLGAFRSNSFGGKTISELDRFQDQIIEVQGKSGFNAFYNTGLSQLLEQNRINSIVILGVVTSVCIDSTGRSASEKGYDVTILSDCTASRTNIEQTFYCEDILPLYANVTTSTEYLKSHSSDVAMPA